MKEKLKYVVLGIMVASTLLTTSVWAGTNENNVNEIVDIETDSNYEDVVIESEKLTEENENEDISAEDLHNYNRSLTDGIEPTNDAVAYTDYWAVITTTNHGDVWVPDTATVPGAGTYYTKLLQACLNKLGYNAGTEDGIYGTNTKNAIIRFQRANKLDQDGVAGEMTWRYMDIRIDTAGGKVNF